MSYQITFSPTEEVMKEYTPWNGSSTPDEETLDRMLSETINYCMKDHKKSNTSTIMRELKIALLGAFNYAELLRQHEMYNEWKETGSIAMCGWEYSREGFKDKEDILRHYVSSLTLFADVIPTKDWYTEEELFMKKYQEVSNIVESFIEDSYDVINHSMIRELKEKNVKFEEG